VDETRIADPARKGNDERLRELEERYWKEDLGYEERCELEDLLRVLRRLYRKARP
jgi:hypothetical protein